MAVIKEHSRTYHGLDALRGVAAIAVLLFHSESVLGTPWLAPSGPLAVDLFFVMSGFVIAHSYGNKIPVLGARWFMMVRLIRFAPLFYLGGIFGLIRVFLLLASGTSDTGPLACLAYFLFLPAPPGSSTGDSISALNGPGWSLLLEIYVNAAYALLLPRLSTRVLGAICAVVGAALAVTLLRGADPGGPHWNDLGSGLLRVCFSFSLGVLIYRNRERLKLIRFPTWMIVCAFSLAACVPGNSIWFTFFILVVSPMLVIAAVQETRDSWLARYGAASSYCIYAIHFPLLSIADGASHKLSLRTDVVEIAVVAAILVVAPFINRYLDAPFRAALKRRFGWRRQSEPLT